MILIGAGITAIFTLGIGFGSLMVQLSLLGGRAGLGVVHFYDRWVWRFSDPVVQGTIAVAFK
jgi:hypothetical protein